VELIQNAANWLLIWEHLRDLGLAYLLALPIAWDREISERTAGLRTFPLVAVAACAYMLTGYEVLDSSEAHARVMEGLITGIGFIGGGAILKDSGSVRGTATAASLWGTGAIGLAVASQRLEIAVVVSVVTFLTLRFLKPLLRNSARPFHKPDSQEDS
jgi:putative Mg2+ transporter-C (MgtC) family protein